MLGRAVVIAQTVVSRSADAAVHLHLSTNAVHAATAVRQVVLLVYALLHNIQYNR